MELRHLCASIRGIIGYKVTPPVPDLRTLEAIPHLENKNVEPSAQFSDGDASDQLFRVKAGGAGPKSRSR
jgi:hypothetical protein